MSRTGLIAEPSAPRNTHLESHPLVPGWSPVKKGTLFLLGSAKEELRLLRRHLKNFQFAVVQKLLFR